MNKLLSRVLTFAVLITLLFSSLPVASFNQAYAAATDKSQNNSTAEKRKQQMKSAYSISDSDIQSVLDQGYTLDDMESALQEQKSTGKDLASSLNKVKPHPVNHSNTVKSTITSDIGTQTVASPMMVTASTGSLPDYSYVQTKPDEAPYTVRLDQETVSTLSGALSTQVADLSLPGRNGLGFTLIRTYDSGSSQFDQMATYGSTNGTEKPNDEKMYPIGKGWSWNLTYIETSGTDKFLHLAGSGVFKIDASNNLVGYPWKDLTFAADTTVTVGTSTSAYSLKSIQGIAQYFDAAGHLIEITDPYLNTVTFTWSSDPTYGTVLTNIKDAINNSISISYSADKVVLTKGNLTVYYYKTTQNGKELLTQVIDPIGRGTTYDYAIKDAQFNLLGTTPTTSNPYALLTGVTHPTGAKTVYTYEDTPVTRYLSASSVNQVYRVKSREDQVTLSDGTVQIYRHKDITYPTSDIGSSYNTDFSFSTAFNDGLTTTTFTNKKHYVDDNNPPVFYNTSITATNNTPYNGVTYTNTTDYTYDEARKWPVPIATKVTKASSATSNTRVINTSKTYDDYGNITSSVDANGITTVNTFDGTSHLLVGVTQPISDTQTRYSEYVRDPVHGNVTDTRVRDGSPTGTILQETANTAYDTYGNATETHVYRAAGVYTTILTEYNTAEPYLGAFPTKQTMNVTAIDDTPSTVIKQYDYDSTNGRLVKFTDGRPLITTYQYDNLGRVIKATHLSDGSSIGISYNDYLNQIQTTDETGVQSQTTWNPLGWKVQSGILDNGTYKNKVTNAYDVYGRLTSTTDALGNTTTYGYDQWGRQNSVSYPDGGPSATAVNDDIANSKTTTDAEGYVTKQYYDNLGRTKTQEETKKVGTSTQTNTLATFTYDNAGDVLTTTDGLTPANTTTYGYDILSRLTSVTNAKNETTSYSYDMMGNLTTITYPDGKTNGKQYDELGRLIQATEVPVSGKNNVEQYYYDADGNQTGLVDRNGNRFKYTFDGRNFLTKKEIVDNAWNPIAGEETISFGYDLAGRRTSMNDATGTTGYAYSPVTGALTTETYPDQRTIKYDYDAAGNRIMMNDPFGVNTYYHYDARNRLDIVAPSNDFLNNSNTTDYDAKYTYYNNNLLQTIQQGNNVSSTFSYDGLRIGTLVEKKSDGSILNSFSYTYDNNGNEKTRTEQVGTNPATTNNFTYDQLNRISTSDQFGETYNYDNRGNRTSMTTNHSFDRTDSLTTFDKRDRLTIVGTTPNGGDGPTVNYRYNGDGTLWERIENGTFTRYYNDGDQVIAEGNTNVQIADNTSSSIQYTGSWTAQNVAQDYNGSMTYSGNANDSAQLTFTGTSVYVVARKGPSGGKADIVIDGITVASDVDTYPNSATNRQFQSVIYAYSNLASGSHTIKIIVKGTKNVAAVGTNVMLDYIAYGDGSSNLKARYIRGNGLVARQDRQGKSYYVQNGHGDVVDLMDSTGMTKLNQYSYDMWGNIVSKQENIPQPFKYSGEMQDSTTWLQYLHARWYDPSVGRFIGEDTYGGQVTNPLSLNRFTYVSNNPLIYTDPTGHKWVQDDNQTAYLNDLISQGGGNAIWAQDQLDQGLNGYDDGTEVSIDPDNCASCNPSDEHEPYTPYTPVSNPSSPTGSNSNDPFDSIPNVPQSVKDEVHRALQKPPTLVPPTGAGLIVDIDELIASKMPQAADIIKPGPNAGNSIPARGPGRDFTQAERDSINEIGSDTGCHTCGSTSSGTKSGNFIPDHQPPSSLIEDGESQQLYPQCASCSAKQGGFLSWIKRIIGK